MKKWDGKEYSKIQKEYQYIYGKRLIERSKEYVSNIPASVLDMGCGEGTLTAYLADTFGKNANISGIDLDESMVENARLRYPQYSFELSDMSEWLKTNENSIDYIFSNAALHWLQSYDKISALFDLIYKRLSGNGIAVLHFSLFDNGLEAKKFLYKNLSIYLGINEIDKPFCEYQYPVIIQILKKQFNILYNQECLYKPFEKNNILNFQWMITSQPILHLTGEKYSQFVDYLYAIWLANPIEVEAHQCEFIIRRR